MDIRDKNSVITEWILKAAVIFFVASLFFEKFIVNTLGGIGGLSMGFFIKVIFIVAFGLVLSVLEKNIFKIAAFTTIIVGSIFKILIYVSQVDFRAFEIVDLSDYLLMITVSIYYLSRHFKHTRSASTRVEKPSIHNYMNKKDAFDAVNINSSHKHHNHSQREED